MKFCFNGTFFSSSQAAGVDCEKEMNIFSRGVFETLRTYHEDFIFARKEHLSRLWHSAKMLSIPCSETQKKTILRSLDQLVAFNRISKTNLRIKIALFPKKFWIETQKLIPPSASIYTSGVAMTETTFDRPFAMAKYTTPAYQKFLTKQGAAFETIFFDTAGYVREGNISNIFILLDGKIFTPQKNILKGITREKTIQIIRNQKIPFEECEIHRDDMLQASEIFLTNTTKEIVPVSQWKLWRAKSIKTAQKLLVVFRKEIEVRTQMREVK